LRNDLRGLRRVRRTTPVLLVAAALAAVAPRAASAGFFDFLFNNQSSSVPPQANAYANPFGGAQPAQPLPPIQADGGGGGQYAHCVRMCDGRYFPILARSGTPPAQLCQAFCPASATRVFFGSSIDSAMAASGERYSETANAYLYRKQLSPGCTCNGRDPTGLAPIDVSLDTTLRPGDIVATATGLVAFSGTRAGNAEAADFTPVSDYAGLTGSIRDKLTSMKVAPVKADVADDRPLLPPPITRPPTTVAAKRAAAN
jgi:Protein of unknown function (DUF2865)